MKLPGEILILEKAIPSQDPALIHLEYCIWIQIQHTMLPLDPQICMVEERYQENQLCLRVNKIFLDAG